MSLFTKVTNMSGKALLLSALTIGVMGAAALKVVDVQAQNISIGGPSDCDSNAVMYCGAHSVNDVIHKYNNSGSVKDIYAYFGIGPNEVRSMDSNGTKVIAGSVTRSGDVLDNNGKVIATSALTAGRQYIAGSNHVNYRGTSFYTRPPSVSFQSNSLAAFVVLKDNGQFNYAILAACGNPVKANPKQPPAPEKKPAYDVEKKVKVKGSGDEYGKSVKVKPGTHVMYTVNVKSTGEAAVQNVNVKDNLPAHVTYVAGTLSKDGNNVGQAQANKFFSTGVTVDRIAPSTTVKFTFEAIVGPNADPQTCKDEKLTNVARINSPQLPADDSSADVTKNCTPPKPEFKCVSLQAVAGSRLNYTFKAKSSSADGAKIKAYTFNFGDGKKVTVKSTAHNASTTHSYANLDQAKTYNATVTVHAMVNGKEKTDTGPACKVPVKVAPQPAAECTGLTLTVGQNRSITAQAKVATKNGAQLTSINYDFDDGTNMLVNNLNPVSHTYANDGEYLVKATVTFNINGQNTTSLCQAPVTFTPPTCEETNGGQPCVPTCEEQNGGQSCEEQPVCDETSGKEVCEAAPTTLVNTGPGETAAMFAAVTILGTIGYRTLLSRRLGQF